MNDEVRKLAKAHWDWIEGLLEEFGGQPSTVKEADNREFLFVEAFIHGYKHGKAGCKNDRKLVD